MSSETQLTICRNENCKTDNNSTGGMVFQYESPDKGKSFFCEYCKSEYIEEDGNILYKAVTKKEEITFDGKMLFQTIVTYEEIVLESSNDYENFYKQYETNHVYFPRLILKNIKEPDYKGRNFTFSKCRIDELVIEDINIISAYYPISFSECKIGNIRISKSRIIEANRKEYKSLWHYFGINFFNTEISESFTIGKLEAGIMISDCQIHCPVNISGNSKINLAMIHNKKDPSIIVEKKSVVNQLFETKGHDPSVSEKKLITSGKALKDITIEELHIDPDIENKTVLENCIIRKLIYREGSTIRGKLFFKNCYIESIHNEPYCFEQDLIFLSCTFNDELIFSKANYRQSLVVEACLFLKEAGFNDLKIEKDLHLSYTMFTHKLTISCNHVGGYLKSHFIIAQDDIKLSDNVIEREVNFRNVICSNNIELESNEIKGYLFLRQIRLNGNLDINWLGANELTIDDITIYKTLNISNSNLNKDLRLGSMDIKEEAELSMLRINGDFLLTRSSFKMDLQILGCQSNLNVFMNNEFFKDCNLNSNSFHHQGQATRNLIWDSLYWIGMNTKNITIADNYILNEFVANQSNSNNINIDDNLVAKNLELKNTEADDVSFSNNHIMGGFDIDKVSANDIKINSNHVTESFRLNNTEADDIYIKNNHVGNDLDILFIEINDLFFTNNRAQNFRIFKGSYAEIDISKCEEIGTAILKNLTSNKDIYIKECYFLKDLTVESCNISNKLEIHRTLVPALLNLKSNQADFLDIESTITKNLDISTGSYRQIEINDCKMIGSLSSNNTTVGKDFIINENVFYDDFKILYCKVENDLELKKNEYWGNLFLSNNTVNGSLLQKEDHTNRMYIIGKNIIRGNFESSFVSYKGPLLITDNIIEQHFKLTDPGEDILYDIEIERNKFNYVNIGSFLCEAVFTFDHNNVQGIIHIGKREGQEGKKSIHFKRAASICENRIRSGFFSNAYFNSAVCFFNNFIERDLYFHDAEFDKVLDLGGTFIGGSCIFRKSSNDVSREEGDLILDNCFIDKKVEMVNTRPSSFSFNNATLNGFNIPNDWKISFWTGRFFSKISGNYIFRENMLQKTDLKKEELPYRTMLSHVGPATWYQLMYETWSYLQWVVFPDEQKSYWIKSVIRRGEDIFSQIDEINTCVLKNFYPVYYGFMSENQLNNLQELAKDISEIETNYEDNDVREVFTYLRDFFSSFGTALEYFRKHTLFSEDVDHSNDPREIKNEINESLREQFKVLRHIFGSDGDLVNEDRAYGKWMHFKNVSDRKNAFLKKKTGTWLKFSLKGLLFEKIFGWGVNLPQILLSTLGMVIIFTFIYYFMFLFNPGFTIEWDKDMVQGADLGFWDSGVFALQTTFSAALGDWAPIGSGWIKVPMTINAVLGVLMVTFLIGAYGRKMLR